MMPPPIARQGQKKPVVADLPFVGDRITQIWRKDIIPMLVAWAGSQEDPFGTNSQAKSEAVSISKLLFPATKLDKNRCAIMMGVVHIHPLA
jgi:hypothetical protein